MMNKILEEFKPSVALMPQSIATNNKTGNYVLAARRNVFLVNIGTTTDAATIALQVLQGTSVVPAASKDVSGATCTATMCTNISKLDIETNAATNGQKAIINGVTYTKAAAYSLANKEFVTAADLILLINGWQGDTLYAVAGAGNHLTVTGRNPGFTSITYTGDTEGAGKLIPLPLESFAWISLDSGALDLVNGYKYIALKVTTVGTVIVDAFLFQTGDYLPITTYAAGTKVQPNL
jgi:hypothetical protein